MRNHMTQVNDDVQADSQQDADEVALIEVDELLREFRPEESLIDRMLLYQITGRELDECMVNWRESSNNRHYQEAQQVSFGI